MAGLKKGFYHCVFVLGVSFLIVSCSSMNYFKKTPENKEKNTQDLIKISQLESDLFDIRQEQAKLKLQMDKKEALTLRLQNTISNLEKKMLLLEKKSKDNSTPPVQYKSEDTSPADLYKKARNLLLEEKYAEAATLFTAFVKNHPQNSLADNAVYWLGECHYSQGEYKKAISVFNRLETNYPKSEKVPDAILKIGYSYLILEDTNRAHHYLKKVLKTYPFSPAAEKAQEKLGEFG